MTHLVAITNYARPESDLPLVFDRIRALVLDAVRSHHTKLAYSTALDEFLSWYAAAQPGPLSKAVVQRYRATVLEARGLAPSSINVKLAAVRKLAAEAAANGLLECSDCASHSLRQGRAHQRRPHGQMAVAHAGAGITRRAGREHA